MFKSIYTFLRKFYRDVQQRKLIFILEFVIWLLLREQWRWIQCQMKLRWEMEQQSFNGKWNSKWSLFLSHRTGIPKAKEVAQTLPFFWWGDSKTLPPDRINWQYLHCTFLVVLSISITWSHPKSLLELKAFLQDFMVVG